MRPRLSVFLWLFGFLPMVSPIVLAQTPPPTYDVTALQEFTAINVGDAQIALFRNYVDKEHARIETRAKAEALIALLLGRTSVGTAVAGTGDFACIIHVTKWAGTQGIVMSNWYVYDREHLSEPEEFQGNRRLFGIRRIYVLAVHFDAPDNIQFNYKYRTVHRTPANILDLKAVISGPSATKAAGAVEEEARWALGSFDDAKPPSDVFLTASVATGSGSARKESVLATAEEQFDNEGLYHWDISIGVPLKSYTQLQSIVDTNGQVNQANIDKHNVLALFNWYCKPVDIRADKFLAIPHVVAGVALASKPLHAAMVGVGFGPAISNFYLGAMITTDNLPNGQQQHHTKLAFGLNFPIRLLAGTLGLKNQIQ